MDGLNLEEGRQIIVNSVSEFVFSQMDKKYNCFY